MQVLTGVQAMFYEENKLTDAVLSNNIQFISVPVKIKAITNNVGKGGGKQYKNFGKVYILQHETKETGKKRTKTI